jgi:hypothetical protein
MILEEYIQAKNTTHIVTICKVYNEGGFDKMLEQLKPKEKQDEKTNQSDDSHNARRNDVNVQEEGIPTSYPTTSPEQPASGTPGHEQVGDVQNVGIVRVDGTRHVIGTDPAIP